MPTGQPDDKAILERIKGALRVPIERFFAFAMNPWFVQDQALIVDPEVKVIGGVLDNTTTNKGTGTGPTARALMIPVANTSPVAAVPTEIYDNRMGDRSPLNELRLLLTHSPWGSRDAVNLDFINTDSSRAWESFAFTAEAAAGGTLAATAFLAAPGAGLKWQIGFIALQAVQGAGSAGRVSISDSVGRLTIGGGGLFWGRKQATANTALTIDADGLAGSSSVVVIGSARKAI